MTALTTAQKLRYTFKAEDGFGKPVAFDEANTPPVAASADETKAQILEQPTKDADGTWGFTVRAIAPGDVDVSVAIDADVSEGQSLFVGQDTLNITEDPRFGERRIVLTAGAAEDA